MAAEEPVLSDDGRLAVVDVGSNTLRLLLSEGIGDDGAVGERSATIVALKRGAAPDGTLASDALERLEEALAPVGERVRAFAPARAAAVCTSAVRDAPNRDRVAALLRTAIPGIDVRILAGEQEAAASFAGASLAAPGDVPVVMIDVGGGSTELVTGAGGRRGGAVSLDVGSVRHTDRHVRTDPPGAEELEAVRRDVRAALEERRGELGPVAGATAITVAGTATTLAAIDLGGYDPVRVHRHRLPRARIDELTEMLAALPLARRREVPGLEPARAGVITTGAVILSTLLEALGCDEALVSERDLLDGVALAAAGRVPAFRL